MRRRLNALLAPIGATLDGHQPWDPQIRRSRALGRLLFGGTLGAGEAYMDGDWDCDQLDELAARLLGADRGRSLERRSAAAHVNRLLARLVNLQTRARARHDIAAHYDLGDDLYAVMLGPTMTYSGGYWRDAVTLDEAQDAKHALICRKLGLRAGQRVLDIGCGWGGFAKYAAAHHGVEVVGVTLSTAQGAFARRFCAGLPVEIHEQDYRDVTGSYDHMVSIGMFEHVGPRNHRLFFERARRLLKPGGLLLLQTIGAPESHHTTDPWVNRYIFPDGVLPSAAQITRAIEGYSDRFRRGWRYYLLTAAGAFRAHRNRLWQLVLSPDGVAGGYRRPLV